LCGSFIRYSRPVLTGVFPAPLFLFEANSRWAYLYAEAEFDITQHFRAGKHIKQFEKAVDTVLSEEDNNPRKILRKKP
jgi:hypothetical protein